MPAYRKPGSYVAGREIKLFDTTYQPGDDIPLEVVKQISHLSALLSSRAIVPDTDPHYRRTNPRRGTPTDVPASVRRSL